MRKLNFLSIEYFLKVAETLNFTVAARELYISQPALSKQIRQLEEELGIRLFKRDTKQVELTEGGRILCREWTELLQRSEKAIGAAKNAEEKQSKKIRVGIVEFDGVINRLHRSLNSSRWLRITWKSSMRCMGSASCARCWRVVRWMSFFR